MFTGLIQTTGQIETIRVRGALTSLTIRSELPTSEMQDGESVAVDGVCLTVTARGAGCFSADVVAETLRRTTLGRLRPGTKVHLERALQLGDRLGGHLVQGHVDGVVPVMRASRRSGDFRLRVRLESGLRPYVAYKGSITLHGVSLTVAAVGPDWAEVALIPETLERTTLGRSEVGRKLNLEVDLLARYLESLLQGRGGSTDRGDSGA